MTTPRNEGNGTGRLTKVAAIVSALAVLAGAGAAIDSRYAKAADVDRALTDIREGLQDIQIGQLQTARALLSRELFDYQVRGRLTDLERRRARAIEEELGSMEQRIDALKRIQDARKERP
ncbi:MAG: hypothetical protein Q8S13_00405 [Dehalococcoidia bacterium]|nr:hypothetical protein [Dehalococcoidia bacterium]